MSTPIKTRVLVVGGGPGGYVTAIRAGQLGLDVTLVEADRLGGTCLIRGCIPSKALIHAATQFASIAEVSGKRSALGISINAEPQLNLSETIRWKDGVVDRLNQGVAGLLKRAKVRVVNGWARFTDAKSCLVDTPTGALTISAEHVVLANGSEAVELPGLPFGGPILSSTEALSLQALPRSRRRFDPLAVPAVCFTEPEIVSVGLSPGDSGVANAEVITAQFPFAANGRALSMQAGETGGFVRVLARKGDHRLLGIQAVGAHVSELSGEFALALEMGATLEDVAGVIHAHPTLSEAFFEASLAGLGHALHV